VEETGLQTLFGAQRDGMIDVVKVTRLLVGVKGGKVPFFNHLAIHYQK
jgi:hypothetical protein